VKQSVMAFAVSVACGRMSDLHVRDTVFLVGLANLYAEGVPVCLVFKRSHTVARTYTKFSTMVEDLSGEVSDT
jgi:hypothetical protein